MKNLLKSTTTIIVLMILAAFALQSCTLAAQLVEPNPVEPNLVEPNPVEPDPAESKQTNETSTMQLAESEAEANSMAVEDPDVEDPTIETPTVEEPALTAEPMNQDIEINGLTADEVAGLIFMREEEKLAHDVYLALYDLWGLPLFQNIAGSEETHTGAVKRLLDRFSIPDPADTTPPGIFTDPDLQKMYDDLVALGEISVGDALKVGAAIEEIDILDLQDHLSKTENTEIIRVYTNLLKGSQNHLRAFTSTLFRQTGETYQPQYMDENAYQAILSEANGRGAQNRKGRP
jgi:hypothetical protein